jgi:hypothetical protein
MRTISPYNAPRVKERRDPQGSIAAARERSDIPVPVARFAVVVSVPVARARALRDAFARA